MLMYTHDTGTAVTASSFRGKPSNSHIIWTETTRDGVETRRFDEEHFQKWATHVGFDFETATRVDHERNERPRTQYRVVFSWGTVDSETIEFDDDEWSLGPQKTPRTFIEIDDTGAARVKGWHFETVIEIREMRHKGPELLIDTEESGAKRLNGRKFVEDPRERQREGT